MANFPWYDSIWLSSYVRAKSYIAENRPDRLEEFISAFTCLRTSPDFQPKLLPELFDSETRERLKQLVASLQRSELERHELLSFGRQIVHDHPLLGELQAGLTSRMSEWVGEEVEPCYNFLSLYNNLGVCEPHLDAPSAKWTLDYCIEQSEPWPIHFSQVIPWPEQWPEATDVHWSQTIKEDPNLNFTTWTMQENQALVFGGSSQWHYRNRLMSQNRQNYCNLAFFHYIPKAAGGLVKPKKWAQIFGIPELDEVILKQKKFVDVEKATLPTFLRSTKAD